MKPQQRYLDLAHDLGGKPDSPLSLFARRGGKIRDASHARAMMSQLSDIAGDMLFGRHTRARDLEDVGDFMGYLRKVIAGNPMREEEIPPEEDAERNGSNEDDVVDAIAPNKHYYRPLPGEVYESVTGIGGRHPDDSLGDPAADVSVGHLGLDENGSGEKRELYKKEVRRRLDNLSAVYGPEKAEGMLTPQERAALEEGSRIEFRSDHGVAYSGVVHRRYGRNVIVEMDGGHRVGTTVNNPTIRLLHG